MVFGYLVKYILEFLNINFFLIRLIFFLYFYINFNLIFFLYFDINFIFLFGYLLGLLNVFFNIFCFEMKIIKKIKY